MPQTPTDPIADPLRTLFTAGSMAGLGDGELLDRFVAGAEPGASAAFEALVIRHGPMVLRACRRRLDSAESAEDAAQAVFLILARKARSIRRRESAASWLYGVAGRVARRAGALERRRREAERGDAAMQRVEAGPPGGDEGWSELYAELDRLPESLRAPVVLCYLEGQTNEQAAAGLRVPLRTLRRRLARARERLRERLMGRGMTSAAALLAPDVATGPARSVVPPGPWIEETVRAAALFAKSAPAPATAAGALAQEVLKAMTVVQIRVVVAGLLLGGLAVGLGSIPVVAVLRGGQGVEAAAVEPEEEAPPRVGALAPKTLDGTPVPSFLVERPRTGPGETMRLEVVSAATGEPVQNATVRVWKAGLDDWFTTDDRGRLDIEHSTGPADTSLMLDVWGDGFAMRRQEFGDFVAEAIPERTVFRLQPGERLGGIVREPQGRPIGGATVFLWSHNYRKVDSEILFDLCAVTGPDGRWSTAGAPATTGELLSMRIMHPDYASERDYDSQRPRPSIEELRAGTAVSILQKGPFIEGRVVDAAGNPVAGAAVGATTNRGGRDTLDGPFAAVTNAAGRFRTGQLAVGEYHLLARAPGMGPGIAEAEIGTGVAFVELKLAPPRALRIRVSGAGGEPLAGAPVDIDTWNQHRGLAARKWTNAEGLAEWGDAPEGAFLVRAYDRAHMGEDQSIGAHDEEYSFELESALDVRGAVVDAATKRPIDQARVEVGGVDPETGVVSWDRAASAELAVFRGRLIARFAAKADAYRLRIATDAHEPFVTRVLRRDEVVVHLGEVALEAPGATASRGFVRLPDGSAAAAARVFSLTGDENPATLRDGSFPKPEFGMRPGPTPLEVGPDGSFLLPTARGKWLVLALDDRGYAYANEEAMARSPVLEIRPYGRVVGRYLMGGRPAAGLPVSLDGNLQTSETSAIPVFLQYGGVADADGRFTFDRVIPGPLYFLARRDRPGRPGFWDMGQGVQVESGRATEVEAGARGRPVAGRLVLPDDLAGPVDFTKDAAFRIESDRPDIPYPVELFRGKMPDDQREWIDWRWRWQESPEGRAYYSELRRSILYGLEPDGSFRIDTVPPGTYRWTATAGEAERGDQSGTLAKRSGTFTIDEVPGGYSDEPLELGPLTLSRRVKPQEGQPAPAIEVTTTERERRQVPGDTAGKLLVLEFADPHESRSYEQIAGMNELFEKYGKDGRVAFLSLVCAADEPESQAFIEAKGQPWPQAIVGTFSNPVASAYAVEATSEPFFLIGPDGTLLARTFDGRDLGARIEEALGRPGRGPEVTR